MTEETNEKTLPEPTNASTGPAVYADLRGDALEKMFEFAGDHMKSSVGSILDPVSGAQALVRIAPDGSITPIPASHFNDYLIGPRTRGGSANLLSLDSFIAHVNRFSDEDSVVFADNNRAKPTLTAVLDYHLGDKKDGGATVARGTPRYGRHRSLFSFPLSDEWNAWQAKNQTAMSMTDFALFLEDHIVDVMPLNDVALSEQSQKFVDRLGGATRIADPAALMTLAQNFQVYEASNAGQSQNLSSGTGSAMFETIHMDAAGQPLQVPQMFVLGIPVFKKGPIWQVLARLRYRKTGGNIVFFYELWRLDLIFEAAFNEAVEAVETETGLPVLLGSPEATV